ncbi:MAG: hypothetical protein OXI15_13005 [Chromatiales bacterium]|nr:hypothetical protein [Chromatiales bacterium]
MAARPAGGTAVKLDQLSLLVTMVLAFTALAALVLTGQAGIREDMRSLQAAMLAGQAELRTGQAELREDLGTLGTRLAVVEHRTDGLEARLATTESPASEPCEGADCPGS